MAMTEIDPKSAANATSSAAWRHLALPVVAVAAALAFVANRHAPLGCLDRVINGASHQ
jgi:hypothetical protein